MDVGLGGAAVGEWQDTGGAEEGPAEDLIGREDTGDGDGDGENLDRDDDDGRGS